MHAKKDSMPQSAPCIKVSGIREIVTRAVPLAPWDEYVGLCLTEEFHQRLVKLDARPAARAVSNLGWECCKGGYLQGRELGNGCFPGHIE